MGLKLSGRVPASPATPERLAGARVAIDAPNLVYAFYTAQLAHVAEISATVRAAALAIAIRGSVKRILDLADVGARAVLVMDGEAHPLKRDVLEAREKERKVPRLERDDYAPLVRACEVLGVPVVHAPHDAEAQAAWMAEQGRVELVATTDWDALAMGAPRLLRNLSGNPSGAGARSWAIVDAADAWPALAIANRYALAEAAILMGCDYSPGIRGVGPKKALRWVDEAGCLEAALQLVRPALEYGIDGEPLALPRWRDALGLFVEPPHVDVVPSWTRPHSGAVDVLQELGFLHSIGARLARLSLVHEPPARVSVIACTRGAKPPPSRERLREEPRNRQGTLGDFG